jgi:hypothetical protein
MQLPIRAQTGGCEPRCAKARKVHRKKNAHVVVFRVDWFFHEWLADLGGADAQEFFCFLALLLFVCGGRKRLDGAIAVHQHVARHRDAMRHERVVHVAPVKQQVLLRQVIHHKRGPEWYGKECLNVSARGCESRHKQGKRAHLTSAT